MAVAALLAAGAALGGGPHVAAIEWRLEAAWSEPWRWWSAAWVHYSDRHLAANLVALALVAALGWVSDAGRREAAAWSLAWPMTHVALVLEPQLPRYGGLSGVLHAGVAVVAVHLLRTEHGPRRALGALLLAGLAVKVVTEAPWAGPLGAAPGLDVPTAPAAHLAGTLCGTVLAWALGGRQALAPARP